MVEIVKQIQFQSMFVEAHIADLHFGVMDPRIEYNILREQFVNYLAQMNVLDIICIEGDLFDHKFLASSDVIMYVNMFITDLVNICRMKDATLILISGTGSHDADQMRMFYHLTLLDDVDVRVVTEMKFVYVKGKKILCIPELYNKGEVYYNRFLVFSGFYDACYMHGTFKGAIRNKNERDLNSIREPVFDMSDFDSCLGPIISGHNHVHSIYNEDFFYCGSPIRWMFGEEQQKGFIILLHDIKTRHYHVHFEPVVSFRYDTITLDNMLNNDLNTIIQYIDMVKSTGVDHLRVMFNAKDCNKIALLKSYYRNIRDITIQTNYERESVATRLSEMEEIYKNEYSYLFDPNLGYEEKLVRYMNSHHDIELSGVFWTVDEFRQFIEDIKNL